VLLLSSSVTVMQTEPSVDDEVEAIDVFLCV
jgi:hypothetical protein